MKEVKTPRKPMAIYYAIVLLMLLLLNLCCCRGWRSARSKRWTTAPL